MFTYPTSDDLKVIEQVMVPELTMDDPLFDIMPIVESDHFMVSWEQMDDYDGLQQLRGLDGRPLRVSGVGANRYNMQPGVYGEFRELDETELTVRRQYGSYNIPIDVTDLVARAQEQLLQRRIDRIRQIGWDALQGRFSVSGAGGKIQHVDQFPVSTLVAGVSWGTPGNSTPLANFRAAQLFEEGRSTSFGAGARAFMNRRTFNNLVGNTNVSDIAGRRTSGLQTVLNLEEINRVLLGEGLPTIVIYHKGYKTRPGGVGTPLVWQSYIPNGVVIIVADRNGAQIAEYQMTRNATNHNMEPGAYTRVIDDEKRIPRNIEVHDGHNGGPAIYFPGDIVIMKV